MNVEPVGPVEIGSLVDAAGEQDVELGAAPLAKHSQTEHRLGSAVKDAARIVTV